jgi:glycosyltransferase involved in cell wall biosynthesis
LRVNDAAIIGKSCRQIHNLRNADAIWADSQTNVHTLIEHGVTTPAAEVIPLVVDWPTKVQFRGKPADTVEVLYVGRFVRSKGVRDLVQGLAVVRHHSRQSFRLSLVGNLAFSDPIYLREIKDAAAELGHAVEFLGTVDEMTLESLYHRSHILGISSYHEGFCKPVVEALRGGCIPVGYAAGNLPHAVGGLGRLVPPSDVEALASALSQLIEDVAWAADGSTDRTLRLDAGQLDPLSFDVKAEEHVAAFELECIRQQTICSLAGLLRRAEGQSTVASAG